MRRAADADRGELVTRGEFYRALWLQAAALIGTQLAIAGFIVQAPMTWRAVRRP